MYDPLVATDIMNALNIDGTHLQNATIYGRVRSVVDYFSKFQNPRKEVLKLLARKPGNALDVAWTYTQLQMEKQKKLASLNPEDFDKDVADEIVSGHITKTKKDRIRADIKKQQDLNKKQLERQLSQAEDALKKQQIADALPDDKLDFYSGALDEIDVIDQQLANF